MPHAHIEFRGPLSTLNCVKRQKRLACLVSVLAREVERLDADNLQLRAAVGVYRDLVRSLSPRSGK